MNILFLYILLLLYFVKNHFILFNINIFVIFILNKKYSNILYIESFFLFIFIEY